LRCEVCGRKIHGKPVKALIEGAKLTVCGECAKHGTIIWEEPKTPSPLPPKPEAKPKKIATLKPPPVATGVGTQKASEVSLELVDDYDVKVRQAREKMGLTHEEKVPAITISKQPSRPLTLGDLVQLDKERVEEKT